MPTKNYLSPVLSQSFDIQGITYPPQGAIYNAGTGSSHLSLSNNYMWTVFNPTSPYSQFGGFSNIRADYAIPLASTAYPDSNTNTLRNGLSLTQNSAMNTPNSNNYGINQTQNLMFYVPGLGQSQIAVPNTPAYHGY